MGKVRRIKEHGEMEGVCARVQETRHINETESYKNNVI